MLLTLAVRAKVKSVLKVLNLVSTINIRCDICCLNHFMTCRVWCGGSYNTLLQEGTLTQETCYGIVCIPPCQFCLSSEGFKPISVSFYKNGGKEALFLTLSLSTRAASNTQENVFFWGIYFTSFRNLNVVCIRCLSI